VDDAATLPVHDVIRGDGLTIRKTSPDRLLVAGQMGVKPGRDPDSVAPTLLEMTMRLLGHDVSARVEHAWSTRIGVTADAVPHVWRDDGMWFGGGYNGDAIVPAMALGSQLGDVLAGTRAQSIFAGIAPPKMRRSKGRLGAAIERRRKT
jgi:glycine/D-amino acid oxidase-like deaminating enzyme